MLKPSGIFIASLGSSESEEWIEEDWFSAPMYWIHFGPETNTQHISSVGLIIEIDEIEELVNPGHGETERHHWALARKPHNPETATN